MRITLYSRPECHLCEAMREVAVAVAREAGATLEEVCVDEDPEAAARWDLEIPVLCIDGEKAFSVQVTPAALRRRLGLAGR